MTLNQQYRQYLKEGGNLTYKQWREATKEFFNATGTDLFSMELDKLAAEAGVKPQPQQDLTNKYIFGIREGWFIAGSITVAAIIGFAIYWHYKKK